jgi:hypothetical protein
MSCSKINGSIDKEKHNKYTQIINHIRKNEDSHFLAQSVDDCSKVSYAKTPDCSFNNQKRTKTTLGRYIKRNVKNNLSDAEFDSFCSAVSSYLTPLENINDKITYLSGDDIVDFYKSRTNESCMCGENSKYTKLYALNPDKVSMVVYDNCLRALLWDIDGTKVLDRVYPSGHIKMPLIKKWAIENNIVYRKNLDKPELGEHSELSNGQHYEIDLINDGTAPYMDTFTYGRCNGNKLTLSNDPNFSSNVFTKTNGVINGRYSCNNCGCELSNAEYHYENDHYCQDCFAELFYCCCVCNDIHAIDDSCYVSSCADYYCEKCASKVCFVCDSCDCVELKDNLHEVNSHCYCESCFDKTSV